MGAWGGGLVWGGGEGGGVVGGGVWGAGLVGGGLLGAGLLGVGLLGVGLLGAGLLVVGLLGVGPLGGALGWACPTVPAQRSVKRHVRSESEAPSRVLLLLFSAEDVALYWRPPS